MKDLDLTMPDDLMKTRLAKGSHCPYRMWYSSLRSLPWSSLRKGSSRGRKSCLCPKSCLMKQREKHPPGRDLHKMTVWQNVGQGTQRGEKGNYSQKSAENGQGRANPNVICIMCLKPRHYAPEFMVS